MENKKKGMSTKTMVLGAVLTALVVILQLIGRYTAFFGPFSTALPLIPIVIGAATCGVGIGTLLGLVFGVLVLFTNSELFLAFSIPGTVITVLFKGMACGFAAGVTYKFLKKLNNTVAVIASAVICPIVNTSVFLLGCALFFVGNADAIAAKLSIDASGMSVFYALASANFLLELGMNIVLSPSVIRVLKIREKL